MGLIFKKQGVPALSTIAKLSIVGFLFSFASAMFHTIWALYMDSFFHSEVIVGLFAAGLTLFSFICYFLFVPFIEKNSKSKIYSYTLFLFGITYILFSMNTKLYIFVILAFMITLLYTIKVTSYGIMIRDKSKSSTISQNEALVYTSLNIAWVLGPLVGGFISVKYGFNLIFILSGIFIFLTLLLFKVSKIQDSNISKKPHKDTIKNFREFFKNKQRTLSYIISGGVNLWWGFIYLFVPLHIIRSDLSSLWVGYFLFAIAIPLILSEYKFSKLIPKWGYKKMFKTGYIFVAIVSFSCFFLSNIFIILGLLVVASFGMAMLESNSEAYFFRILKKKSDENRFYGPYNTTIDINAFIARASGAMVLVFLPFQYLFILYGLLMFTMFLISSKVKDIF